jgi:uncharacterized protein YggE
MLIEHPWGIAVQGTAKVAAPPDVARVRVTVAKLEQTPSTSFAAVSDAVQAVRATLRDHGVPDAGVRRSRLDLKSTWHYGQGERQFRGYQSQGSVSIESTDLDDAQQLIIDLVAAGVDEIASFEFDIRDRTDLEAAARRRAIEDARRTAQLFADAAGVRLGAVLHIEDRDYGTGVYELGLASGASGVAGSRDLVPGEIEVSAAVLVGFAITP